MARQQAQERNRDALMDAAEEDFYEGRWQKTSLEAISARAGVTKQTLLRQFGSKDGLLLQTLMRGAAQVLEQRWSAPVGDISGAVENLVDHYEKWGERALRIGDWQSGPPLLAKMSTAARQVHYDWVEHTFAPWLEVLDEQARRRRRAALIAVCDVQAWRVLSHDLGLPRAELQRILIDMIERLVAE